MSKKTIAVLGATGAQGGGLVDALRGDSEFEARALTRDAKSDKAKALSDKGVAVMSASLDDEDSLVRAFEGAHGVFCVTAFWEHFSPEKEYEQAGRVARAAKRAGVAHTIWSTLEDTRQWVPVEDPRMPTLHGKYKVPHFDAKGAADKLFAEAGAPTTCLRTSFYWENLVAFGMGPKKGDDGKLHFVLPMADKKLPGIAVIDIGKCARGVFHAGDAFVNKTIGISGEHLTGAEMAAAMTKALGTEVVYDYVPPEVYRTFGFPGADDLANMFQVKRDFEKEYCANRTVESSRALNPELLGFAAWLELNKSKLGG